MNRILSALIAAGALLPAGEPRADGAPPRVAVGSKSFTESVILGEIAARAARSAGALVEHRRQLGGTRVLWNALEKREIDIYPEYTGTIAEEILRGEGTRDAEGIRQALARRGVSMSRSLGFNNTYAVGMREETAQRLGVRTISDLARHPQLKLGFSSEFMDREDGWPGLSRLYRLSQSDVRGLDHDLAYRALESAAIDATDLYSTDAEVLYYRLRVLQDDLQYFPDYQAVLLYRQGLNARAPEVVAALTRLEGRISQASMIEMNGEAKLRKVPESRVAADFLERTLALGGKVQSETRAARLLARTREHLSLVGISLLSAVLCALPLGILAARRPGLGQVVLAAVGTIQTIPSLALLVFMIPLLGIGGRPAVAALFLYSLLPIVRNTHAGLKDIPPWIRESAEALGLGRAARLRLVELPLASRSILAGIKTSAVINVGTATLGALVGAGGYGQPILTGIRLDDLGLILEGAIPAALLALLAQALFELLERRVVPKGLRLKEEPR
jgi:osmoprotectant transport system permease protein